MSRPPTYARLAQLARASGLGAFATALEAEDAKRPTDHTEGQRGAPCRFCAGDLTERECVTTHGRPDAINDAAAALEEPPR